MESLVQNLNELVALIINLISTLLLLIINPIFFIPMGLYIRKKHKRKKLIEYYEKSTYFKEKGYIYAKVENDLGLYGEYLTYDYLKSFEEQGAKFLFNAYIPRDDNTTEIDVMMITSKGIFVIESKNYSGWIYGEEYKKNWCQTFKSGHKEYFFNPVYQNKIHVRCLRKLVGDNVPLHSIIAFSDRCELKSIWMSTKEIKVINRYDIYKTITEICESIPETILDKNMINGLYEKLYPYTQVDESVKAQHIERIMNH